MIVNGAHDATSWDEARHLGQLFMVGFDGTTINDQVKVLIEKYHVAAEHTTQLVLDLQTIAYNAGHPVPLLIAIDQEGGGVNSLYDETHIQQFPSAMGVAASRSKQLARYIARATAQELAACGINWILGPVLNVLEDTGSRCLGVRSLSCDPQEVSAYGSEFLQGYQEGGLATCGKRVPLYEEPKFLAAPHEAAIIDPLEQLSQTALFPFRNVVSQGIDAIMVGSGPLSSTNTNAGHLSLSEQIIQNLLRHEMHFSGVVLSECLVMEDSHKDAGIDGGVVAVFNVGCDIISTCRSFSAQEKAINGLQAGLENGSISRGRFDESLQRVLDLKGRYTSWDKAFSPAGVDHLTKLQRLHSNISTTAYNKSITIVRDQNNLLPLSNILEEDQNLILLTPLVKPLPASSAFHLCQEGSTAPSLDVNGNGDSNTSVMSGEMVFRKFGRSLARRRNGRVLHASYTANGLRPIHENLLDRASAVIVITADAGRNLYQYSFTKHINTLCKFASDSDGHPRSLPCIVIAVSSPFDFVSELSIETYICTYDFTESALQALVRVLCGEVCSTGVLPVALGNVSR